MPNIQSAIKNVKKSEKARLRNKSHKSAMRTQLKKLLAAFEDENLEQAKIEFPLTVSILDKLAQKNILHLNKASRDKAKLQKQLNELIAKKAAATK